VRADLAAILGAGLFGLAPGLLAGLASGRTGWPLTGTALEFASAAALLVTIGLVIARYCSQPRR
jgi:hypothetical protein